MQNYLATHQQMSETPNETVQTDAGVTFFRPKKKNANSRKRENEPQENEDEQSSSIPLAKKHKDHHGNPNALTVSSKNKDDTIRDELLNYKSSGKEYLTSRDGGATATIEYETEVGKDDRSIRERGRKDNLETSVLTGEDAERAEKVYKGMAAYTEWIEKKEATGVAKGAGIKAGPVRLALHIKQAAPMDYDKALCKDYKETGFCGWGDSCKFVHDRTDYKSGWELDKEWDEQQKNKKKGIVTTENLEIQEDDNIPFACPICRKLFVNPVVTKCEHVFCEKCALTWFKSNMKCQVCGKNTGGAFKGVDKKLKEKLDKRRERALSSGEYGGSNNDDE